MRMLIRRWRTCTIRLLFFSDIVIRCSGSLESFSNDFIEADEDLMQKYHSVELYIKKLSRYHELENFKE